MQYDEKRSIKLKVDFSVIVYYSSLNIFKTIYNGGKKVEEAKSASDVTNVQKKFMIYIYIYRYLVDRS